MTVVALAGGGDAARRAAPLLALLGRRCTVISWHRWCAEHGPSEPPDALVATDVELLGVLPPVPTAVWVGNAAERAAAARHGAAVLLTDQPDQAVDGVLLVRAGALDVARVEPAAPLVRARRRDVAGRPEVLVTTVAAEAATSEGELSRVSAAVVLEPAALPLALALGTPVVTNEEAAERLGAAAGDHLLVAPDGQLVDTALRLALDPERAARCSAAARRFAEEQLDLGPVARAVALALGVEPPAPLDELTALHARLDELAAPPDGWVRRRMAERVAVDAPGLGQTPPMPEPHPTRPPSSAAARARGLVARAVEPLRSRVKGALASAAAQGQAELRAEVDHLQRDLEQTRLDHAVELAVLHEELAALKARGVAPPAPC